MRVIIVEDELHNYRLLRGMIENLRPEWEIVDSFESVRSTVNWLKENEAPDLIFMDVQLTDGNCFAIFDEVDVTSMVVFTTAYDEYAIQAFKVRSIDYLLKPIKEDQLEESIKKFEYIHATLKKANEKPDYSELIKAIKKGEKKYRKRFLVSGATSFSMVEANDVAYFYTESRVTFAVTFKGEDHIIDLTMEKLEEQLDPERFFRANRSVIINSEAVKKFESYFGGKLIVKMIEPFEEPITISRLKATAFKNWLDS